MTIYFTLTYALLVLEMVVFTLLVLPFPVRWRRAVLTKIANSPSMTAVLKGLKFVFAFIFVLFLDSVNRLQRMEIEFAEGHKDHDYASEASHRATRFYTQRNLYLTGFTLFLSLILERTTALVTDMLRRDAQVQDMKKESATAAKDHQLLTELEMSYKAQIATLQSELGTLKEKDLDIETLKQRAAQLEKEYDQLTQQVKTLKQQ